jgi:hypothetical protein
MRHSGLFKPASIANEQSEIQIVDTHESLETRVSIGFAAHQRQINRTLLEMAPVEFAVTHRRTST